MEPTAWKEQLKKVAPEAPVEMLTLERVSVHRKDARIVVRFQSANVLNKKQFTALKA